MHAIDEPLLLKAFLACGARHLSLVDPTYGPEKAIHYEEAATQDLLHSMQDPNRDSVLCATAALILSIYEAMSLQPTAKHMAGSRALIRECSWTAKTPSLGGSCFWTSVSIELLDCLSHNWPLSWNPDSWGVDMNMDHMQPYWKSDDHWLHRIMYICAKIANFRVSVQNVHAKLHSSRTRSSTVNELEAVQEWNHYNSLCEKWNDSIPRSMKPLNHAQTWQHGSTSRFPKIW